MYLCDNCGKIFEEPNIVHTTYETYYGVSSLFNNSNKLEIKTCPKCGCDSLQPYEYDYEEEEEESEEEDYE